MYLVKFYEFDFSEFYKFDDLSEFNEYSEFNEFCEFSEFYGVSEYNEFSEFVEFDELSWITYRVDHFFVHNFINLCRIVLDTIVSFCIKLSSFHQRQFLGTFSAMKYI